MWLVFKPLGWYYTKVIAPLGGWALDRLFGPEDWDFEELERKSTTAPEPEIW